MLSVRKATESDVLLYFEWANDETVRQNAINSSLISMSDHVKWFTSKLTDPDTIMLVFSKDNESIGQLRIEMKQEENEAVLDYSVDKNARGKGFGTNILSEGFQYYLRLGNTLPLTGFVKVSNKASISAFLKAGFVQNEELIKIRDQHYIKFRKDA